MPKPRNVNHFVTITKEYAGKWIAWNSAGTRIIASARTLAEAKTAAEKLGEPKPVFEKVPRANTPFIGARS